MVRLSDLILIFIAICSLAMVLIDFWIGLVYVCACLPAMFYTWVCRNRPPFVLAPIYTAIIAFHVFYFVRPLLLTSDPMAFGYPHLGIPTREIMMQAIAIQGVFALFFLSGLYLVMHVSMGRLKLPAQAFTQSTIAQLGSSFLFLLGALSVVWLMLIFFGNVAQKGVESGLELFRLVLPTTLIVPVAIAFLADRGQARLNSVQRLVVYVIIVTNILATVLAGSKAGLFLLILYVVIFRMLTTQNFRMPILRVLFLGVLIIIGLGLSVIVANVVRNANFHDVPMEYILSNMLADTDFLYILLERITYRFVGHEGMLATLMHDPDPFRVVARWDNILTQALSQILPGVSFGGYSVGKAVGLYFEAKDASIQHAGALGITGMLYYMHGLYFGPFMAMVIGVVFGFMFRLADTLASRGAPERIAAFLALGHLMATWISSGNFDRLIQNGVIVFSHMIFYYAVLRFLLQVSGASLAHRNTQP